jgi:hypothetical protein
MEYTRYSRASLIEDKKNRRTYRLLEIFPGAFSWFTLIAVIVLSWLKPVWMAVFVIAFVTYFFFRTLYFSFHLTSSYRKMREYEKIDWLKKLEALPEKRWQEIYQLVVYPVYRESLEIVRAGFKSLVDSDWPKEKMIAVLTYEERAGREAEELAQAIGKEFENKFFKLVSTCHPGNLPGEIAGKGSNENWGIKKAKETVIDSLKIPYEKIIVSSFDADSVVFPRYFSCLAYHYLTCKNPLRTSFQPIPLFINNIWQAPPISKIFSFSASFWEMMCLERTEKLITFSSHSMSFRALVDAGFYQPDVVSEDSRIFWQCFLEFDGNYEVVPVYYPISMDANVSSSFFKTMKAVYRQIRRWAYGVENVPYYLFGFAKNKKIPFSRKFSLGFTAFETYWSWATNSFMIFLLGWLPIVIGGDEFRQTMLSYSLPILTRDILTVGMIGLVASAFFSIMVIKPKSVSLGPQKYFLLALEWFLLPLVMMVFVSLPALEAQTRLMLGKYMGFWPTEKFRKK